MFSKLAAPLKGDFIVHLNHVVDNRAIEVLRYEASTNPLNTMLSRLTATDHWRLLWLYCDRFEIWIEFLQIARDSGNGSSWSDASNDGIDLTSRIRPNFGPRGSPVDVGVVQVVELLQHDEVGLFGQLFGFGYRAGHAF